MMMIIKILPLYCIIVIQLYNFYLCGGIGFLKMHWDAWGHILLHFASTLISSTYILILMITSRGHCLFQYTLRQKWDLTEFMQRVWVNNNLLQLLHVRPRPQGSKVTVKCHAKMQIQGICFGSHICLGMSWSNRKDQ